MNTEKLKELLASATPGPWRLVVSSKGWMNPYQIERADGACLFSFGESPFHDNAEADARIIAAAPEAIAWLIARAEAAEKVVEASKDAMKLLEIYAANNAATHDLHAALTTYDETR